MALSKSFRDSKHRTTNNSMKESWMSLDEQANIKPSYIPLLKGGDKKERVMEVFKLKFWRKYTPAQTKPSQPPP